MLASIEARLRRLNKMAQRSAIGLSSLLPTMHQRGGVEGGGEGTASSRGEQELPEWKFFNKVQSMHEVEGEGIRKLLSVMLLWIRMWTAYSETSGE